MSLLLNCDLGESYGSWTMGLDAAVMPFIDQANIACGFHAGDPLVMQNTLALAKKHDVMVGAHPGYPDLVGFGRRSMNCSKPEIIAFMHYQMSAIWGMAKAQNLSLDYVKPHGALYNDMMANIDVRCAIMQAIAEFPYPITLMLQATPAYKVHQKEAEQLGIKLWFEAFADRCYDDDGKLLSRTQVGAVHNKEKMIAQVEQLCAHGTVTTVSGNSLAIHADTLCVHGDNMEGINAIQEVRERISK
ncbi:5-oxoprolinase subunit PxpA [Thalassotalea nanhaiensis]|uniref:5-oxoprolinase subunit PxpA n=1 Tax=Thalassotalea nanhaiensis TaxID=3065648 RepID=A0ABY9TNC7_9GAMM|nr:5-oxoprolinase subunit PxpA [Colwelliaceae bacterium SQ345]